MWFKQFMNPLVMANGICFKVLRFLRRHKKKIFVACWQIKKTYAIEQKQWDLSLQNDSYSS